MTKHSILFLVGFSFLFLACPGPDPDPKPSTAQWTTEIEQLEGAMLAVSPLDQTGTDLISVGGPLRGDTPPTILRRSTSGDWNEVSPPTGFTGAIWWSWAENKDNVWMVGEDLQVANGPIDKVKLMDVPMVASSTKATLYGVWGSGPNDVWMVGGSPLYADGPEGVIFHYDGQSITKIEPTGTASVALSETFFKVWGTSSSDVMIVGTNGTALHYDGSNWTLTETGTTNRLLTVHGRNAFELYAVGGAFSGNVLQYDGFRWREIGTDSMPFLNGVFAAPDGTLWVCGPTAYVAQWDGQTWTQHDVGLLGRDFHGIFAGETGVYAAGGILAIQPGSRAGTISRFGK